VYVQKQVSVPIALHKALGTDTNGNYVFEVEASNEDLDLDQQKVLQTALLQSQEHFLSHGVISKDHLHSVLDDKGHIIRDEQYVIGEPLKVFTKGTRTFIRGILYKSNKYAQEFIRLLKDGSTRIKASIGGLFPTIKKNTVTEFLWNDVALTIAPVNTTVTPAVLVKSMNTYEFVQTLNQLPYINHKERNMGVRDVLANLRKAVGKKEPVPHDDVVADGEGQEQEQEEKAGEEDPYRNPEDITGTVAELSKSIQTVQKSMEYIQEIQKAMGEALCLVLENTDTIATSTQPRKGAVYAHEVRPVHKSLAPVHKQFDQTSKLQAMTLLQKAIENGKAHIGDALTLENQINLSIRDPKYQIEARYAALLRDMAEE
jgi:hypothetical protein